MIGGAEPNLADFQIATSIRLLLSFEDVRGLVERRPAAAHALAVVPRFPGAAAGGVPAGVAARGRRLTDRARSVRYRP